jgi:demethylspheroidene O-methyltransferase
MFEFPDQSLLKQRQQLREMAQGFRQAQILLACVQLGVFEALNPGQVTALEVAQAIGADPRGVELLLNAAAALDLLDKAEDRFSNKPLVAACLLPGAAGTMSRSFRLQAAFYQR